MQKKLKNIIFIVGLLPVIWYIYHIQGKLMNMQIEDDNDKTVLDAIVTPDDALALFPRSQRAMQDLVTRLKKEIDTKLAALIAIPASDRTFDNTARALDTLASDAEKVMSLFELCQMVYPEASLRTTAQSLQLELHSFIVDKLSLNKQVYYAFKEYVYENRKKELLSPEQEFYLDESIKDFKRSGFELDEQEQEVLKKMQKELAELTLAFEANIAHDVRSIAVTADELEGLTVQEIAPYFDAQSGKYILKTDYPTVDLVLQNCSVESTRKALWKEFQNRAYPQNNQILSQVIKLRHQIAHILGYPSYTALNIDGSMAESPERVEHFLHELEKRSEKKAQQEFVQLTSNLPVGVILSDEGKLKSWDVRYVMHQYKKNHAAIDERVIAEYFPLERTIDLLLELYEEFLGLTFEQVTIDQLDHAHKLWHKDVKLIKTTQEGELLGYLFLDLHPRDNKYTHACHGSIIHGLINMHGDQVVPAVSLVIANFPHATAEKPALLLRNDVNTFFHEFGHAVHALCGATQLNAFSGTKTKRDFVELPSQMLEEWLWQPEILKRVSGHYQSGLKLHDEMIDAIIKIKNIDTGFFIRRQLVLAYLSLACFNEKIDDNIKHEYQLLFERLMPDQEYCPEENFIASFGHLMGYGAQYYGYLWSKVFALDLFHYIKSHGMSSAIGARYRDVVIGKGGSKHPGDLLRDFLGRDPQSESFFKEMGI